MATERVPTAKMPHNLPMGVPEVFSPWRFPESVEQEGYIHAVVVQWEGRQQPVPVVQVPPGRQILLSARGGDGEAGRTGGDGQSGLVGVAGAAATREQDAQVSCCRST
jgi:hypothetical protein